MNKRQHINKYGVPKFHRYHNGTSGHYRGPSSKHVYSISSESECYTGGTLSNTGSGSTNETGSEVEGEVPEVEHGSEVEHSSEVEGQGEDELEEEFHRSKRLRSGITLGEQILYLIKYHILYRNRKDSVNRIALCIR